MKRYKIAHRFNDGLGVDEDPNGEWVQYEDVAKILVKLTQGQTWNSPNLKPIKGAECLIVLLDGRTKPAMMIDGEWIKLAGYIYDFNFKQSEVIKWRYDDINVI